MAEELRKLSAFEAFAQTQQTYVEAEEKAKKEAGAPKVERWRIDGDGEYSIRILPLAPSFDSDGNILPMERKGYEYPLRQLWLKIKIPAKKGSKPGKINVPVIRATDEYVGKSIDLIDTYVKIAREMYSDDEKLLEVVNGNSFGGGLRWDYLHPMYLLDVASEKERSKGPQLWYAPHGRYKEIDAARMRLWRDNLEDDPKAGCPITGFTDAYPVKVIRTTDKKTEYTVDIGRKFLDVKEEEVIKLLDLPRIPELIYRYTRYQMEATIAFLKQYDEDHQMEVCSEPDFQEAIEKLSGELSPEDTSHFDLNNVDAKAEGGSGEITLKSLWQEHDAILDQELGEKSDEYQDLREKIRQYIEDNDLDVRISRTKTNQQLLDEIEEAEEENKNKVKEAVAKPKETEEKVEEPEEEPEEKPGPRPTRRPRPGSTPEPEPEEKEDEKAEETEEAEEPQPEEAPRRRSHRRLR